MNEIPTFERHKETFHDRFVAESEFERQMWFFLSLDDRKRINSAIKTQNAEINLDKLIDISDKYHKELGRKFK